MNRFQFLRGCFALGGGLLVGCSGIGRRTVVDAMVENGYILGEATYQGRSGHVVRGFDNKQFAAAGDGRLSDGTEVVLIYKNGILVPEFLDDVYAPPGTVIQPVIVRFKTGMTIET